MDERLRVTRTQWQLERHGYEVPEFLKKYVPKRDDGFDELLEKEMKKIGKAVRETNCK